MELYYIFSLKLVIEWKPSSYYEIWITDVRIIMCAIVQLYMIIT